ncbi:MAG: hypothetical protein ACRCST_03185 [Turicibacter sp.]
MNAQTTMGCLTIMIGLVLLSIEVYCLKFVQRFDLHYGGSSYSNALDYIFHDPSIKLAVTLSCLIVIFGIILLTHVHISKKRTE